MYALRLLLILLGLWFLVSAILNWDWIFALYEIAAAETLFGEDAARWLCGIFGLIAIGTGVACLFQG